MTELEPLFEDCDDFERALLRSTGRDAPSASALPKTLAALGLDASALASSAAAGSAPSALGASSLSVWTLLKFMSIGALVGTAVCAVAGSFTPQPPAPARAATLSVSRSAVALALAPGRAIAAPMPETQLEDTPAAPGAMPRARRDSRPTTPQAESAPLTPLAFGPTASTASVAAFAPAPGEQRAPETPSAASIAEEVKTLDRARQALAARRASEALAQASAYMRRWPHGALAIEAVIVRIESELALGDRASAERDAREVIRVHPGSRYASRVSALFSPALSE